MRPREKVESGQTDMFRPRLDQIIDIKHPLVRLKQAIDWGYMREITGPVYKAGRGQPPLPTELMVGLAIIKHMDNLSDEQLTERWVRDPYYQYLCEEEFFQHKA